MENSCLGAEDLIPSVIRVATYNNFNFTNCEFKQLKTIQEFYSNHYIFVNSNAYPHIRGTYPCFICINPDLVRFIEPYGKLELIKAVRIKYVSNPIPEVQQAFEQAVAWSLNHNLPILITYMRFRSLDTLRRYTTTDENYLWQRNYFRQRDLKTFNHKLFYYCDIAEQGCPSCMNCPKLAFGFTNAKLYSLNLSTSGFCIYDCPDCYVKAWKRRIRFDTLIRNKKMRGYSH